MTLQEVCNMLGLSEGTLERNFPRTKERFEKRGIILTKTGKGVDAVYYVELKSPESQEEK